MRIQLGFCALALLSLACDDSNGATVPSAYGAISLESASDGVTAFEPRAFFYKYTSSGTGVCDVVLNDGVCRTWKCNDAAYSSLPGITVLDAGPLSVSGANRPLEFEKDEKGYYAVKDFDGKPLWSGGETLTATSTGAEEIVPITISVTAPPPVHVSAPVVPPDTALVIDSKSDLPVSWDPLTTADSVYVAISTETEATLPDGSTLANIAPGVDCLFNGTLGTGVVRAALLTALPKPDGLKAYHLDVLTYSALSQRFGNTLVELRANWLGLSTIPTIQ